MRPRPSMDDVRDCRFGDAVVSRKDCERYGLALLDPDRVGSVRAADRAHLLIVELGERIARAAERNGRAWMVGAPFGSGVGEVLCGGSEEQVRGVDARADIAAMANLHPF